MKITLDVHQAEALGDVANMIMNKFPKITKKDAQDYVLGALEIFIDTHLADSARWEEWLGDMETVRMFFDLPYEEPK